MPYPIYTAGFPSESTQNNTDIVFFGLQLQDYFRVFPDKALPPSASRYARVKYLLLLFIAF
jgi:hypothetical protein